MTLCKDSGFRRLLVALAFYTGCSYVPLKERFTLEGLPSFPKPTKKPTSAGFESLCTAAKAAQWLGKTSELRKIRIALFEKRVFALFGLLAEVIQQRGVASELLDARLTVELGVERRFEHAQGNGALL